jgi:hypothetical protein
MTTAHQFGSQPTTAEKLDRALELIAALSVGLKRWKKWPAPKAKTLDRQRDLRRRTGYPCAQPLEQSGG